MPRPLWKGTISFGLVSIPVALVSAEDRTAEISFTNVDSKTKSRVKQKRVSEATGDEVPWDDVVKGYEYDKGQFVILTPEEIEAANPRATRTIDIVATVSRAAIDPPYFETPYYVVPEPVGRKPYALLREVLHRREQLAVARIVLRTRQYLAALYPVDDALVLNLLRYPAELRSPAELDLPGSDLAALNITDKEIALAEQLVAALAEQWQPGQYQDTYRADLMDLIRRKIAAGGGAVTGMAEPTQTPTAPIIDIMELLKRSVAAAEQERSGSPGDAAAAGSAKQTPARRQRKKA